jgi:membrane-bound lytic murein transglycosylase MltF
MRRWIRKAIVIGLVAICSGIGPALSEEIPSRKYEDHEFSLPKLYNWKGDFDGMMERRAIRVLVPYSKTLFFLNKGREYGVVAELMQELERWINKREHAGSQFFRIVLIPKKREDLINALNVGEGDVVAANLRVNPNIIEKVDFALPVLRDVKEIIVTGPASPSLGALEDLSGTEAYVRMSSSYAEDLKELNERFEKSGKQPVKIIPLDENLEDEDILEMVNAGLLPYAVVHQNIGDLWQKVFTNTKARDDLAVAPGGNIAWAIRKDSPLLKNELDLFIKEHAIGTGFGNSFMHKYYTSSELIKNSMDSNEVKKFTSLVETFKKYGDENKFDYLFLAAQGFQESQLDQTKRSPRGAVGIMQLLPSTAAAKPVSIVGVDKSVELNIKAGAIYMRHLRETYVNDPAVDDRNQMLMALAAYNAGPGNLRSFRGITKEMGLNPNIWFKNVERGAAKKVGIETVQYVSNIYKYYLVYKALLEREAAQNEAKAAIRGQQSK